MADSAVHEGQTNDYECKIAKYIIDKCANIKNLTINGQCPKLYNIDNAVIIDFKAILLSFNKLEAMDKFMLEQTYDSLIKITIPITNNAIVKAIDEFAPSCSMGFAYEQDFKTGIYKIIIGVNGFSETRIVNEMAMEDMISLLESEKDDRRFEYFSSTMFVTDACRGDSPRKMRKYAQKAEKFLNTTGAKIEFRPYKMNGYKQQFNINYGSPTSIAKGTINKAVYKYQVKGMTMFTKNQIATMKAKVEDNIKRLNKTADEIDNRNKLKHEASISSIDRVLTEATDGQLSKQYTELPKSEFIKTFKDAKRMYLDMVNTVVTKYKPNDGVYTPGWDSGDWPDPPDKFFNAMSKYFYTTTYNGKKYGQFSIVIAEIDNAKRKPAVIKDILMLCDKKIELKYRIDHIYSNYVGWFVTPIIKNNGYQVSICLNSNDFICN